MDFRGRAQRRMSYPSFALVVNRHILRRNVRAPRRCLICYYSPNRHMRVASAQQELNVDWTMTTVDYMDDDGQCCVWGPIMLPEITETMIPVVGNASTPHHEAPEQECLHAVNDDALTDVSDLNLDDAVVDQSVPAKPSSKGVRAFFSCKDFLEHRIRSFRKKT